MPEQEPTGPKGPVVRRAVLLPEPTGEPDPEVPPEGGAGSAEAPGAQPPGEPAAPHAPPSFFEPAGSPGRTGPEVTQPTVSSEPSFGAEPGGATRTAGFSAPVLASTAPDRSTAGPAASSAASASAGYGGAFGAGATAASAGSDGNPPGSSSGTPAGEEPPSGRRKKALLAAAVAVAGTLLIAVPLLALGAGDDDEKKTEAEPAAGTSRSDDLRAPYSDKGESPSPRESEESGETAKESPGGSEPKPSGKGTDDDARKDTKKQADEPKKPAKPVVADPSQTKRKVLRNAMTRMCANIPGYGKGKVDGPVNQFPCNAGTSDNQLWDFVVKQKKAGPGHANLFVIRNVKDGLCMDLPGLGGQAGATGISEFRCNGGFKDNQLWWLDSRGGGKYWIRNHASKQQCLEVWGKNFGTGGKDARLGIADCNPADDHAWKLG